MTFAVFTASEQSAYDDHIERRYHFPRSLLGKANEAKGSWIVYYEPRRDAGLSSSGGRQAYFAMAQLDDITPDPKSDGHFYAWLKNYIEFDRPVPFKDGTFYYESALQKSDGSTNKGQFGRSIRAISDPEFHAIVSAGFTFEARVWERPDLIDLGYQRVQEDVPEYVVRPVVEQVVSKKFRDAAFRRHVRDAYSNRCAMTGLSLINGGGRPEVQAAHIRSVEADGPDTVRNGLALTGTVHWLFDRGFVSIDDDHRILTTPHGIPDDLDRLLVPDRRLIIPSAIEWQPHRTYMRWHREHVFKQ